MLSTVKNNKITYTHDNTVYEYFQCMCHSEDHLVRFSYFVEKDGTIEDEGLYVSVHLTTGGLWHRIKRGLRYILHGPSDWGEYAEVLFKRQDAERLKKLLETYINSEVTVYEPKIYKVKMKEPEPIKVIKLKEPIILQKAPENPEDGC